MNTKIKKILSKKNKSKIICLTSYSKNISEILDNLVDIILVGDSLGSVLYSYNTTKKVKLDTMIEHSKSVRQGVKQSLMVVDMPYNTYRNKVEALKNAKKIIKYSKADAIKLEGGKKIVKIIDYLRKNKINVMGHLGILTQSHIPSRLNYSIGVWLRNYNYLVQNVDSEKNNYSALIFLTRKIF